MIPLLLAPMPAGGEGRGEGASRRRLSPLTCTLFPSGGEGRPRRLPLSCRTKNLPQNGR